MKSNAKHILSQMSEEDKQKMKEYANSLKEIRKEMAKMISKTKNEAGGNMMGRSLPIK